MATSQSKIKLFRQCLFSARLYKIYRSRANYDQYKPRGFEKWGNKLISTVNTLLKIALFAFPFLGVYFYKRGITVKEARTIAHAITAMGCILALSVILRAYGRVTNPEYVRFIRAYSNSMSNKKLYLRAINEYDFKFNSSPAAPGVFNKPSPSWDGQHSVSGSASQEIPLYQRLPIQMYIFAAIRTVSPQHFYARLLVGVQSMLSRSIFRVQTRLATVFSGQRANLRTADGNEVNTMFVDKRRNGSRGNNLIICCEGNTGFYEFTMMLTPAKAGYSVLGWNHPGFIQRTSVLYPSREQNAMEVVMLYATAELGFKRKHIVMYGWSVGAYAATWAAVHFSVKGLILDAAFDDLLPLVKRHVPPSWTLIVKDVVRSYLDLNIGALITQYNGPIQLVRRIQDEVNCFRPGVLSSNRGNYLLRKILEHRHRDTMSRPLARAALIKILALPQWYWASQVEVSIVSLITKYMRDVNLTHFTPLHKRSFHEIMDRIK